MCQEAQSLNYAHSDFKRILINLGDQKKSKGHPVASKNAFLVQKLSKQAGTSPSRRHIQGSKIAKRLPSVKYSLLQYSKIKNFSKEIFRKNYILEKWTEWHAGAR